MSIVRTSAKHVISTVLAAGAWTGGVLFAGDDPYWPQFHGPKRNNLSTDTGLLQSWPREGPRLVWTARGIGHGFSTVSIAGGRIYTAGNIDERTVITAMDMDGRIQWQTANGKAWKEPYGGTRGTPTVDGDRLYHESPLGDVVCLRAADGKKIWGLNILEKFHGKNITWALAESLLIDGDRVICCPGGPKASVAALDKRTGRTVWTARSTGDLAGYASPILVQWGGLRIILTMTARALIGVNADTGELLWRFEHVTFADENIIKPVYHRGEVFISTIFDAGSVKLKINVKGGKAAVEELWRSDNLDNQHGGVILLDGYLYGACRGKNNAKWICLDWKTGRMMYAERGVGKGSLTYADGMLYILSENRTMAMVKPTAKEHEVVSRFEIPAGPEGPTWAHPVVCGGRLYVRHGDLLYAYDVRTPH